MIENITKIINNAIDSLEYKNIKIILSNREELCDYQSDSVFMLAKEHKKSPLTIGTEIVEAINKIDNFDDYFTTVNFAPPGFINITLSDKMINNYLVKMSNEEKFGLNKPEKEELFFLDYGGYNIAKPLHIGHLRPTIIGEAIKRIIKYKGHKVIADVHLGDYGLQMGQVIYGILSDGVLTENITIDYLNEVYPKISSLCKEDENVKLKCNEITKELQNKNENYVKIWDKILEVSLDDIKDLCNYLGVSFDLWQGESDANKYLDEVENILNSKNLLELSSGATVIDIAKESDKKVYPPMIFKTSSGAYLYGSTDLATVYERKIKHNPNHIIYVTDFRQSLHFEQFFRASDKVGFMPLESLEHAYNGTINGDDNKPFKTRSGSAPKLRELFELVKETFISLKEENANMDNEDLDKIVNAIIKFADLQNSRDKDYIFDPLKFASVVGKTGPYILYTYLRIDKILKNENISYNLSDKIYNNIDRKLRLKLITLENSIELAFKERKPSFVADYIYNLALLTNTFYQSNHITNLEDEENKQSWLYILSLTNKVIKEMLNLIEIEIPKYM